MALLNILQDIDNTTLIFSSSACVYNLANSAPFKESDELLPSSPYGKSKLECEKLLNKFYNLSANTSISVLRYFNPVGSHCSGLLGEDSKGKTTNLFPAIIQTIRGNKEKLLVFGKDWPTPDGTCIRDFIHVMDLAEAHIDTLNYLKNNKPQNISINIGTGKGTSVIEAIETFQKIKDIDFEYKFVERRLGDQSFVVADNKLALDLLKWAPKRNLLDMCKDSLIY